LGNWRLPKDRLVRKRWEYEKVYSAGSRLHGAGFILVYRPNGSAENRLGISIHRKIRGAVKRNRIKRIIRESFRLHRDDYPPSADIVFVVRPGFTLKNPAEITAAVGSLTARLP
jgi:ribonuclease P protein component